MKFLCDRCNARYSIADDRVRGKILKIRCKTCANVITVREGMPSAEADAAAGAAAGPAPGPAGVRRGNKTTTASPVVQSESPAPPAAAPAPAPASAPGSALGAAFASAMTKPPPALEEEWYVSIDGAQSGPFSLGDAQRWIAARPHDADLFCWSEGFDDWLPVDKVSHFRGLRKAPAPAPAPPPRVPVPSPLAGTPSVRAGGAAPAPALRGLAPRGEPAAAEAPKPLFAATMAQLEHGAAPSELRGLGAGGRPAAMPAHGANGASALAARSAPSPLAPHLRTTPGVGALQAKAFDASEVNDGSSTKLEPLGFDPPDGDAAAGLGPAAPGDGDDNLDIGEVSRVVKLADLARDAQRRPAGGTPAAGVAAVRAAAAARLEAARPPEPMPGPYAPGPYAPGPYAPGPGEQPAFVPQPFPAPPPAAVSHRRALIALLAGALVLVGVAVAVVFFVLSDPEDGGSRLGTVEEIDTTRPDEVRPAGGSGEKVATGPEAPVGPTTPKRPGITTPGRPSGPTSPISPETPPGTAGSLEAREIEEMATKNSGVTQRCRMRSQRGADDILIGDVKKIQVTLTINGDGAVTDVRLSDNHAQNVLGKCLIGAIRTWRFRKSPGGTFRFALHFG